MDTPVEISEYSVEPKVQQLISFIRERELPEQKDKMSSFLGYWYPVYGESPEHEVPLVYDAFKKLHNRLEIEGVSNPKFIDLGAGQGIVGDIASAVAFESFNIELDPDKTAAGVEYTGPWRI